MAMRLRDSYRNSEALKVYICRVFQHMLTISEHMGGGVCGGVHRIVVELGSSKAGRRLRQSWTCAEGGRSCGLLG